jgi:hypothetical protein
VPFPEATAHGLELPRVFEQGVFRVQPLDGAKITVADCRDEPASDVAVGRGLT